MMFDGDSSFKQDKVFSPWSNGNDGEGLKELPTQLAEFFTAHDADPEFKCTIQSFNNEMYTGRPSIVGEYIAEIPNYEQLVRMNGAKFYRYKIIYKENGLSKKEDINVDLTSKNWKMLDKEGDSIRRRQKRDSIKEEMEENSMYNAYGGGAPQQSGAEAMKESIAIMTPLMTMMKGENNGGGNNNQMMQFMMLMMQNQQQSSKDMMQMFMMFGKTQSDQVIAMLNGKNNNNDTDKLFNMAEKMIKIQELVSPKEESLIDKIGNFIGGNMDTIGSMLSKPQAERESDPDFQDAKNSWKMKAVKKKMHGNKAFAEKLIEHLDGKLGDKKITDDILSGFMKYNRTEANPKVPQEAQEVPTNDGSDIKPEDFE